MLSFIKRNRLSFILAGLFAFIIAANFGVDICNYCKRAYNGQLGCSKEEIIGQWSDVGTRKKLELTISEDGTFKGTLSNVDGGIYDPEDLNFDSFAIMRLYGNMQKLKEAKAQEAEEEEKDYEKETIEDEDEDEIIRFEVTGTYNIYYKLGSVDEIDLSLEEVTIITADGKRIPLGGGDLVSLETVFNYKKREYYLLSREEDYEFVKERSSQSQDE